MPHVIRAGRADLAAAWKGLPEGPWRWGHAVAKLEGCFLARDERSLLLVGVVVEFGRPLHVLVLVSVRENETAVRLWPALPVERTEAVKRLVARVASELQAFGAGEIRTTNLAPGAGE
ncbi:MAG TPA: hypothetical protein P5234_05020 [Thermoanaerobaculaceae bacterium]|nr:hypothetical protein [Thermoanaerobaculaceae bacterium]HRS15595.1 hypothetical protein [Thermoanaerobaculaceae bacterium]